MDTVRPNTTTTALVPVMQDVWLARTPFSQDLERASVPIGQTLRQVVGPVPVQAWVDGVVVTDAYIDTEVLPRDAHIIVAPMPQGADTWKTIGAIALVVAALALPAVIPWVVGAVGLTGVGAALVTGGLYALAAWGLYEGAMALFPPPTLEPQESFNTLASLTGQRNRMGAFRAIPRLYGRMRYYPPVPMTAPPYTELSGGTQYQRIMLCLGYGPLNIGGVIVGSGRPLIQRNMGGTDTTLAGNPIRIGTTSIDEYDEVSFQIGRPDQITLYTNEVLEQSPGWTTSHDDPSTGWNTDGDSFTQTSDPDAVELSIDIWAALFSVNDEGKTKEARIEFMLEYRDTEYSGVWTVQRETITITSSKRETLRYGYSWRVTKGRYDVRLTRKRTYHAASDASANDASWVALRTIRDTPAFTVPDTIIMALRIRSSDQLQGTLDNVSVEAISVLPVWNGTTWTEQTTRAPAWAYADMLTGTATRRPLERNRLDAAAVKAWADDTDGVGDYFDHVFDDTATLFDRIRAVTAAGRASWALRDDAIMTVVRDVPDPAPRMLISPRNSSGFRYEMAQADIPQALRVQFIDAGTWENTERIVYDDGYDESNTTLYQTIEALGVTSPDQAWRLGRYHLAQLRLRPETYSFIQDVQHLHYRKGDLLHLQQDIIAVGIAAGRITSHTINHLAGTTTINVDIFLTMEPNVEYGMRYQSPDGAISVVQLQNASPGTNAPVAIGLEAPAPDSHFVFGKASKEVIAVKVLSIEPQGEYLATVTCVPAALNIMDALSGTIPPFDPMMTLPVDPSRLPLPIPTVIRIASGDEVLQRDVDGSPRQRMLVEVSAASVPGWGGLSYQARWRVASPIGDDGPWTLTIAGPDSSISIYEVEAGLAYRVQTRTVRPSTGAVSPWSPLVLHTVVGAVDPPPQVRGLTASAVGDQVQLDWEPSEAPDIDEYEVRLAEGVPPVWDSATMLARSRTTSFATGRTQRGPYMVRARNTAQVTATDPAAVTLEVTQPIVEGLQGAVSHNMATLAWGVTEGTWRVSYYELWRGNTRLGITRGTYMTITEQAGGLYEYRVVPVTVAGEGGTPAIIILQVGDPSHAGGEQQFEFAKGTDVDTPPATGWGSTPPATQVGEYVWVRTRYVTASGEPGDWGMPTRMTGESAVTLVITASAGTVFKNNEGATVLTALVYQHGTEVDADGQAFTYTWTMVDRDGGTVHAAGGVVFPWVGKSLTVTHDMVAEVGTFSCVVS